ncbi:MAG: hypothetical protein LBT02_00480 [Rickettsiales bacterium]|jgi:gamma-glutamyl phosphate reductase|nr:hypothetical protein [Rickettsiales bacterium]
MTPKEDELIYEQISQYQDIAEEMKTEIEDSEDIDLKSKQEILFPMIDEITKFANKLVIEYIKYLKDKKNKENAEILTDDLELMIEKIDIFKDRVCEIYELNNK